MLVQDKKIKGFTVLELLIVLSLVGILSALAYPNFAEWNRERAVRADVERINALIKNTFTQTERGSLAYVQVHFTSKDNELIVEGRGLTMSTLASKINNENDSWNSDSRTSGDRCSSSTSFWDTHKTDAPEKIKDLVYKITVKDVTTAFKGNAAICFSRNGKFYEGDDVFIAKSGTPIDFIFLCSSKRSGNCNIGARYGTSSEMNNPDPIKCEDENYGCAVTDKKDLYLNAIKWSRYGNINKVKWRVKHDGTSEWME